MKKMIIYLGVLAAIGLTAAGCRPQKEYALEEAAFLETDSGENIPDDPEGTAEAGTSEDRDETAAQEAPEIQTEQVALPAQELPAGSTAEDPKIYVYVRGAVVKEGVYALHEDARVYEAVEAAGGLLDEADVQQLNMAASLRDEDMICIPRTADVKEAQIIHGNTGTDDGNGTAASGYADSRQGAEEGVSAADPRININTAGADELMRLSGIGQARAQAIMEYREKNGRFSSPEEIMKVQGIKTSVYEKIRNDIRVD